MHVGKMYKIIFCCVVFVQLGYSVGYAKPYDYNQGQIYFDDLKGIPQGQRYNEKILNFNPINNYFPRYFTNFDPTFDEDFIPEYFRNFEQLIPHWYDADPMPGIEYPQSFITPQDPFMQQHILPLQPFQPLHPFSFLQPQQQQNQYPEEYPSQRRLLSQDFGGSSNFNNFRFPAMPRFPFPAAKPWYQNFGDGANNLNDNSAFAFGAVGPGFQQQIAAISPQNPAMPNVNVMNRFADSAGSRPGFKSVSTFSSSVSSNINGKPSSSKMSETIVNNEGKITRYKVQS